MDKLVDKIWKQPNHEEVITLGDTSNEDFPVQPPIKNIEVVFLDSSESTQNTGNQITQDNDGAPAIIQEEMTADVPPLSTADVPPVNTDEEHAPPQSRLQKAPSQASTRATFITPMNFNSVKFLDDGGMLWGSHQSPGIPMSTPSLKLIMYLIELSLSYLVCCVMLTLLRMKLIWELTLWTDLTGTCRYRLT